MVVYPTETAYGLGADAANQKAVDLVFKMKRRPKNKTLPLIASSLAMVKRYCQMSALEEKLAKKYWPGAVTLILDIKDIKILDIKKLARGVIAPDKTVAIRVSSHPVARGLARGLGRPIVSTSANISGKGECYTVGATPCGHPKIMIINIGRLPKRKPSTIVEIKNGQITILRQGEIKL